MSKAQRTQQALQIARLKYDEALAEEQKAAERLGLVQSQLRSASPELVHLTRPGSSDNAEILSRLQESGSRAQANILGNDTPGARTAAGGGDGARTPAAAPDTSAWGSLLHKDDTPQTFEEILMNPFERTARGPSGRVYSGTSVGLAIWMPPRRNCILLAESKTFDNLILAVIILNCITMGWESPLDPCCTWKSELLNNLEVMYLAVFTMELTIKILAYGLLFNTGSYLKDPWCQLDFVVVFFAWLPVIFPEVGNFTSLRAFRALRALRAVRFIPGLSVLVQWILQVLPKMGNVVLLCGFVFVIFGVLGVSLFKGSLHYRCAEDGYTRMDPSSPLVPNEAEFDSGVPCHPGGDAYCRDDGHGDVCAYFETNPDYGITGFDSIAVASIALVEGITFDDWADPMYDLMAASSPQAWIYFLFIALLGGFFVVNLFLPVIFLEYESAKELVAKNIGDEAAPKRIASPRATYMFDEADAVRDTSLLLDGSKQSDGGQ